VCAALLADVPEHSIIAHGAARLPKTLAGEATGSLILELLLDSAGARVLDVATTIALPGYTALLRAVLVGRSLDEVEAAGRAFAERYRGPLLRPTIAALTNAVLYHEGGKRRQQPDAAMS
jgi:hypothetical protein